MLITPEQKAIATLEMEIEELEKIVRGNIEKTANGKEEREIHYHTQTETSLFSAAYSLCFSNTLPPIPATTIH